MKAILSSAIAGAKQRFILRVGELLDLYPDWRWHLDSVTSWFDQPGQAVQERKPKIHAFHRHSGCASAMWTINLAPPVAREGFNAFAAHGTIKKEYFALHISNRAKVHIQIR